MGSQTKTLTTRIGLTLTSGSRTQTLLWEKQQLVSTFIDSLHKIIFPEYLQKCLINFSQLYPDLAPPGVAEVDCSALASVTPHDLHPLSLDQCSEDERVAGRVDCGHQRKVEFLKLVQLRPDLPTALSDGHGELVELEISSHLLHGDGEPPTPGTGAASNLADPPSFWSKNLSLLSLLSLSFRRFLPEQFLFTLHGSQHL